MRSAFVIRSCKSGMPHLLPCGVVSSSVKGGEMTLARPVFCLIAGLSNEYGRDPGSASRGEAFSTAEKETTRGEDCAWPGTGLRPMLLEGDETGMLEVWLRKAEKEGTAMLARDVCLRTPAVEEACCCC